MFTKYLPKQSCTSTTFKTITKHAKMIITKCKHTTILKFTSNQQVTATCMNNNGVL